MTYLSSFTASAVLSTAILVITYANIILPSQPTTTNSSEVCQSEARRSIGSVRFYSYTGSEANEHSRCRSCCLEHPAINLIVTQIPDSDNDICICERLRECQQPVGDQCSWYIECLNSHKFEDCSSDHQHAIHFLWKDCNFLDSVSKSPQALDWYEKSRSCVQRALAPHVATDLSCALLRERAYEVYTRCNLEHGICDLEEAEFNRIADFVGRSLLPIDGEFVFRYENGADNSKNATCGQHQ